MARDAFERAIALGFYLVTNLGQGRGTVQLGGHHVQGCAGARWSDVLKNIAATAPVFVALAANRFLGGGGVCAVVIRPRLIPHFSFCTLATGIMELVVQEMTCLVKSMSYVGQLQPEAGPSLCALITQQRTLIRVVS